MAVGGGNGGLALHCIALHCIALHCIALHCIACIIEKISSAARGCASTNCFGSHGVPSLHVWMDERYRIAYSRSAANAAGGRLTAEEEGTSDSHAEKAHAASPIDSRGLAFKYTTLCTITSPWCRSACRHASVGHHECRERKELLGGIALHAIRVAWRMLPR